MIYLKETKLSDRQQPKHKTTAIPETLRYKFLESQNIYIFKDTNDLQQQFLVDFIKLLRGPLFDKVGPYKMGLVSLDALHSLCKGVIKEQIKTIAQDKYIPDIYTEREAEKEIEAFIQFEETFLHDSTIILDELTKIAKVYQLEKMASFSLSNAKTILRNVQSVDQYSTAIEELKQAFCYEDVETVIGMINSTIRESNSPQFASGVNMIVSYLERLAFTNEHNLSEFQGILSELWKATIVRGKVPEPNSVFFKQALRILPSRETETGTVQLTNDLIKELNRLIQLQTQKCIALVAKAGSGKTNVICHIAEYLIKSHPVILLNGQIEIRSEYDLELHIQRRLESEFQGIFSNWINRINPTDNTHKWLFVLIDGINENNNLRLLIRLLKNFLPKLEDKRIKLIFSCRDTFWDLFSSTLKPYLFEGKSIDLDEFTENEWRRAIQLYFHQFNIKTELDESARLALRNPLLLRFFCEAYRNQQLGKVSNVKLLSVFDLYLERLSKNIAERFGFLGQDSLARFLIRIGGEMWSRRKTSLNLSDLEVSYEEAIDSTSIYNLTLSENIVFEEFPHTYATQKTIRFLYDEFMEYVIARSWVDQLLASQVSEEATDILLQEAVTALNSFSPAFGAILFLDKMLKRDGILVNRMITLITSAEYEFVASRQITMVYAFENIGISSVDSELIIALDKFERIARDEIKKELAPITIQVFRQCPDHPVMKAMISRVLETDYGKTKVLDNDSENELRGILSTKSSEETPERESKVSEQLLALPPGRYHYSEEAKLNAISILVTSKTTQDYELVEEGIRNLGKMDLHSALCALASLDLATDELVYQMIPKYLNAYLPEYRIYCAWLLRERYEGGNKHKEK